MRHDHDDHILSRSFMQRTLAVLAVNRLFGMFAMGNKMEMPKPDEALKGRDTAIKTSQKHLVNGNPMHPPFPDNTEMAMFGEWNKILKLDIVQSVNEYFLLDPISIFGHLDVCVTAEKYMIYLIFQNLVHAVFGLTLFMLNHINSSPTSAAFMLQWTGSALVQPIRHQAITWTNAHLLSIGPLGTNFSEIWINIQNFSFKKIHLKISSAKWRPFCPLGDELREHGKCISISYYFWTDMPQAAEIFAYGRKGPVYPTLWIHAVKSLI